MIFLAVTMGFLAESLRENMSDKDKEKEYISSFISNLEQDTALLKSVINDNKKKTEGLDSLVYLSFKNLAAPANRKLLYEYSGRYTSFYSAFVSNDATMMQLKNSGGLRYIRHSHVADSIARYDLEMRGIYAAEAPYSKAINDAIEATQELLIHTLMYDTSYFKNGRYSDKELPLLTTDPQKLKIFFNRITEERAWTHNYLDNLQERLPYATRLIGFLKKEYDVE
jgi:hypothetical protein